MAEMKFKFNSKLNFQLDAIKSTVELFEGSAVEAESFPDFVDGINSNKLGIPREKIFENLKDIQERNGIEKSSRDSMDFSVEMETGTGKTYVYIRTILELYRAYGFRKFIVLVPSVAIREGVKKALEITKGHMHEIYERVPYSFYEYDSRRLNSIKKFARSNAIEIMIMTVDSFNKSSNIMQKPSEKMPSGMRPIDLVKKTRPILILDEPQNMESEKAKEAISGLDPLFSLRYSATHRDVYNLIYKLTPVDAYNKKLVKRIQVDSVTKTDDFNDAYIACTNIVTKVGKSPKAKLKINKKLAKITKQKEILITGNSDLFEKSGKNDEYKGYVVQDINALKNFVKFTNGVTVKNGGQVGGDRDEIIKLQIERTIRWHLDASEEMRRKGIKVLSLFFIDKVDNYLPEDGFIKKHFDKVFDEMKKEYPDFAGLEAKDVRDGYFSRMRTESKMKEDKESFDLIMKNKERLISFDEKVSFIFSHSALKEGWDNPNVFNICTLNQTVSKMKKRQEIGRGLRLPVNSNSGERVYGEDSILTIIANEHYAEYADSLQKEYEEEYGSGQAPPILNAKKPIYLRLKPEVLKSSEFKKLWKKISRKTKYTVVMDTEKFIANCCAVLNKIPLGSVGKVRLKAEIVRISLSDQDGTLTPKPINTRWTPMTMPQYKEIEKTHAIDNIVEKISKEIRTYVPEVQLTNSTIIKILQGLDNLGDIFNNQQQYLAGIIPVIKRMAAEHLVNGIKYEVTGESYNDSSFEKVVRSFVEPSDPTKRVGVLEVDKSVYDSIIHDSKIEKDFALDIDENPNIKLLIKTPDWFTIKTPVGTYNPDWAIVKEEKTRSGKEDLYLMRETKAASDSDVGGMDLALDEERIGKEEVMKIECARKHFAALGVDYKVVQYAHQI